MFKIIDFIGIFGIYRLLILIFAFLISLFSKRIQKFITRFIKKYYQKPFNEHNFSLYCEGTILSLPLILIISFVLVFPAKEITEYEFAQQLKEYEEYEFAQQIEKLDEMQNSLEDFQILISTQKARLIQTERYIEILKTEKEKLEPIVKANRELVESILTLQKKRTIFQVWGDRLIGFLFSLLAGLVIIKFRNFLKDKKP